MTSLNLSIKRFYDLQTLLLQIHGGRLTNNYDDERMEDLEDPYMCVISNSWYIILCYLLRELNDTK